MEPTITRQSTEEFVKNIATVGGYDLVSDFGQEEIRRQEREKKEQLTKQIVRFSEEPDKLIA